MARNKSPNSHTARPIPFYHSRVLGHNPSEILSCSPEMEFQSFTIWTRRCSKPRRFVRTFVQWPSPPDSASLPSSAAASPPLSSLLASPGSGGTYRSFVSSLLLLLVPGLSGRWRPDAGTSLWRTKRERMEMGVSWWRIGVGMMVGLCQLSSIWRLLMLTWRMPCRSCLAGLCRMFVMVWSRCTEGYCEWFLWILCDVWLLRQCRM